MSEARTTFKRPKYLSQEWFDTRRTIDGGTVFGASECPALMGASAFDTLQDLVVKKINPPVDRNENGATQRGHILEPALIEHCRKEYKAEIEVPEVMFRRSRLVSTLDGLEYRDGNPYRVFEAKTTTMYDLNDPLPESYFWQGQAQLDTTGADSVVFVCLDKRMQIGFWELKPDLSAIEQLQQQAELIGRKIDSNEFISNSDTPFTQAQIANLFPEPEGEIEIGDWALEALELWEVLKSHIGDMQKQEQEIKDKLCNALRDKEFGAVNGKRIISYKRQTRKGGMDIDRLFAEHPEIADLAKTYMKRDSEFRVLRKLSTK